MMRLSLNIIKSEVVIGHGIGISQKKAVERAYAQLNANMPANLNKTRLLSTNLVVTGLLFKKATVVMMYVPTCCGSCKKV